MHEVRTDCKACAEAAGRISGYFIAGCTGCCARGVARSPQFREALKLGTQTRAYRALLAEFELTHEQVKAAHAADAESRLGRAA
jgi:hypothetical protein